MFTRLRRFTVVFLAILQLIAPLVHAHVGENFNSSALHVPGLEKYNADRDLVSGKKIFHADAIYQDAEDGMLIGIDTGIKHKSFNYHADSDHQHYLHQQTALFKADMPVTKPYFYPQTQPPACRLLASSLSPRAPPAQ
ncbi:MAG: hypothetical protein ACXWF8_13520 [Methylobacter sp.]